MPERFAAAAGEPRTRDEIAAAFERVHAAGTAYLQSLAAATFAQPLGDRWSPAMNVRHLALTDGMLTRGYSAPPALLAKRFGHPTRASRRYGEVVLAYQSLGAAVVAPAPFVPADEPATPGASWRSGVMAESDAAARAWVGALRGWGDEALDAHQLEHPLLGLLTLREFAGWNVHHHVHHATAVARRILERAGETRTHPDP